jgi:hypothetical protein
MRKFLLLTAVILFSEAKAQQPAKAPLRFQSYAFNLNVTAEEQLVITTMAGEVAIAIEPGGFWTKRNPVSENTNMGYIGQTFEQANFFNNDTGIVSGFIQLNGKTNSIYHTINSGKTWRVVDMGLDGWVDDAQNLDNGVAWLSVAGQGIAHTEDFGFTWNALKIPDKKQRYAQIFFNDKKEGLIGSLWNSLAYTSDNCNKWKILPTPLDQKKYTKTNKESRPEFQSVALFEDWLFVNQEGLIFYSKKDSINWIWLKQFNDFYTDAVNSGFFLKNSRNEYYTLDSNLNISRVAQFSDRNYSTQCRNSKLYIMTGEKIITLDKGQLISSHFILTDQPKQMLPSVIGYSRGQTIGAIDNKIYFQTGYDQPWTYIFDLPFSVSNGALSMVDDDRILFNDNSDTITYYSMSTKTIEKKFRSKLLGDFGKSGIQKIYFSKGSSGCFHNVADVITYKNNTYDFELEQEQITGAGYKQGLRGYDDIIDGKIVKAFADELLDLRNNTSSFAQLAFTDNEIESCKSGIVSFQKSLNSKKKRRENSFWFSQNNIDFQRLVSLVDSVRNIDSAFLNQQLNELGNIWSTTTNWIRIELLNSEGKVLSISNSYTRANAFHFPWIVNIDGYLFTTTNPQINKFIKQVYPSFLDNADRGEVLNTLVKALYLRDQ